MNDYLAIDIGNSGMRIAPLDMDRGIVGQTLHISWGRPGPTTTPAFRPDGQAWLAPLEQFLSRSVPTGGTDRFQWIVSSVRRDALQVLKQYVCEQRRESLLVARAGDIPMRVNVDCPERLGIDRLLAAWAATRHSDVRPLIVIQAGSAVTIDLVMHADVMHDDMDSFDGGAILPGVPMILQLLATAADMLPEVVADDLTDLPVLPGRNTEAAMIAGAASALVGGAQHLVSRYRDAYGQDTPVILSGGDGMRLSPFIPQPLFVRPQLVLSGLLMLAQKKAIASED